jgi:hypothetical protein
MSFLVELNKAHIPSRHKEMLNGHSLPVVGLTQMKNGLLISIESILTGSICLKPAKSFVLRTNNYSTR